MAGSGALNSPISDPEPYKVPEPPKQVERQKSDYEKLHGDVKYPQIRERLEQRKEFYRRYLPDGENPEKLSDVDAARAWKNALVLIKEIEDLELIIESHDPKRLLK